VSARIFIVQQLDYLAPLPPSDFKVGFFPLKLAGCSAAPPAGGGVRGLTRPLEALGTFLSRSASPSRTDVRCTEPGTRAVTPRRRGPSRERGGLARVASIEYTPEGRGWRSEAMRRMRRHRLLCALGALMLLSSACGRDDVEPQTASPETPPVKLEKPPPEDGSKAEASAAEQCIDLATREDWARALDPCTRAARKHPDDPEIREALEKALAIENAEID
jgi:hypothetical protein